MPRSITGNERLSSIRTRTRMIVSFVSKAPRPLHVRMVVCDLLGVSNVVGIRAAYKFMVAGRGWVYLWAVSKTPDKWTDLVAPKLIHDINRSGFSPMRSR